MVRYHLHISADGREEPDADGHEFNDLRQAVAAAGKTAGEMLYDTLREQTRETELTVRVCGSDDREHAVIVASCRLA